MWNEAGPCGPLIELILSLREVETFFEHLIWLLANWCDELEFCERTVEIAATGHFRVHC